MKYFTKKAVSILLAVMLIISVMMVVPITVASASEVTDTLTASVIGVGSSYTKWSGLSLPAPSTAVYAGNSLTGSGDTIQMNAGSNHKDKGIVTTASGGKVKSVTITVASGTNTINVYGKNTPYSEASDLFNDSNQGTLLGSVSSTGTINVTSDYTYVGIRSNSGGIYLTSVGIVWEKSDTFTVTWKNGDDVLETDTGVVSGATPSYDKGVIPTKDEDEYGTYTFDGWESSVDGSVDVEENLPVVTRDVTYTAHYSVTPKTYTVTWKNYDDGVLETDNNVQAGSHPEYNGQSDPSKPETDTLKYIFAGWKSSVDQEVYTSAELESVDVLSDITFTAQFNEKSKSEVTDVINRALTGITSGSTNYGSWSGKTSNSDAVYSGNSAGGNDAVQLRSDKNTSGIVTTTSGGFAVKVTVSWNSHTSANRTLDIYGKNSAYSAATDLYDSSTRGTLLGSIVYGTGTELIISGDYEYIGIRSHDGALYADKIEITWAPSSSKPSYEITWTYHGGSESSTCLEGRTPVCPLSENPPTYEEGNIRYYFSGWNPELGPVSGDTEYTAVYNPVQLYAVTWNNYNGSTLDTGKYEAGETPVYRGDADPEKPSDDEYDYEFSGWSPEISSVTEDITYTAQFTPKSKFRKTDVLDLPLTGVSGTSYSNWSDKQVSGGSDAVYAGNSSAGHSSIQLRSSDNSGIVSTTSGKRVKEIIVEWNSSTDNSRVLQVYGKNSAYSGPADLYNNSNKGTLLGTIAKNGSNKLTIDGKYAYVGLRSASGAMYLSSVSIVWEPGNTFDVTWNLDNGQDPIVQEFEEDNHPEFDYNTYGTPQKQADAEFTYTFDGWKCGNTTYGINDTLPVLEDNVTYTAVYKTVTNKYTVIWKNWNGEELAKAEDVYYGTYRYYEGVPERPSDGVNTYTFIGWDPEQGNITGDTVYVAQYSSTPIPYCTVTFKNWDGEVLSSDSHVLVATQAQYSGDTPQKTQDSYYTYTFKGWATGENNTVRYYDGVDSLPYVSSDITFTAIYFATPKYKSGRIVSTTDSSVTYNTGGKYYYDGGEKHIFISNAVFTDNFDTDGTVLLGDAVFTVTVPLEGSFAHTFYVTGEGTENDPFKFYPNYIYSNPNVEKVADCKGTDVYDLHPGDGFRGKSKIRMRDAYIRFLQYEDRPDLECAHGTNGFMGISEYKYGNRYANAEASPYSFVFENRILYYLGELNNAHNFSEELIVDKELGNVTPMYTVTWQNWDEEVIRTNNVYQGMHPSYGTIEGSIPERPEDDYTYTFSGWKNAETGATYGINDELPAMSGDVTYIATYTSTLIPVYTVTWKNWNGNIIETDEKVKENSIPSYDGDRPSRDETDTKVYMFKGWNYGDNIYAEGSLPPVTDDVEYTAVLEEYNKAGYEPIQDIEWVFKTNEKTAYDLSHMYYTYNGSDPLPFDGFSAFERVGDTLTLGDKTVADIGVPLIEHNKNRPWHADFADSVYVTGTGSYYDPFEFHPNYLFYGEQSNINNGYHVKLKDDINPSENINNLSYPGDQFKGRAEIAVGSSSHGIQQVHFISKDITPAIINSHWYVGVGPTTYGIDYNDDNAENEFMEGNEILYYYGEVDSVFQFDEVAPVYQNSFGLPESYTVNWNNDDGQVIDSQTCYYGDIPSYDRSIPTRSDNPLAYDFIGWKNGDDIYEFDDELPAVIGDIDYDAEYEHKKLFVGHSLILDTGDIGMYYYIDVNAAGINLSEIESGDYSLDIRFSWKTNPPPYSDISAYNIVISKDNYDSCKRSEIDGKEYLKVRCNTAVAEMTCCVKADAVVKSSAGAEKYSESDEYSVREYALRIINDSEEYEDACVDLVKAMLDYGAKAQTYFRINIAEPANDGVDYEMVSVTSTVIRQAITDANPGKEPSDMFTNTDSFGCEYKGSTIEYLSNMTLRHYYTVSEEDTFNGVIENYSSDKFLYNNTKPPYKIFEFSGIAADQLDTLQEFKIGNQTYYYSAMTYSANAIDNPKNASPIKNLSMATYWYNYYANIFFNREEP